MRDTSENRKLIYSRQHKQDFYRGMIPPLENSKLKGVEGASSLVSEERDSLISRRDIALSNMAERNLFLSRVALG